MTIRTLTPVLVVLTLACNAGKDGSDTDTDAGGDTDVTIEDPCDACGENASCEGDGADAECVCDEGYEGDGESCVDIDECEEGEDDCDASATCVNDVGGFTCECPWGEDFPEGSDECDVVVDESLAACAFLQAEHPSYTTIARDVALCGGTYDASNITTACNTGWHVCGESEWLERYPLRTYGAPDTITATIGTVASWGALQSERCVGDVWEAERPMTAAVYDSPVCPDAESQDAAAYNPWNDGKFLLADDGVTILQGKDQYGEFSCCDWDHSFAETEEAEPEMAVYCCRDAEE